MTLREQMIAKLHELICPGDADRSTCPTCTAYVDSLLPLVEGLVKALQDASAFMDGFRGRRVEKINKAARAALSEWKGK